MSGRPRPAPVAPARKNSMRPPRPRPSSARAGSVRPASRMDRNGAISPADSIASAATAGTKRKERDFERDGVEETNINVVVRCRGRNDREVRENSGVVLTTDGVRGNSIDLLMGPSALSNKTYHFDKVFSPAADQAMIYDDVVTPILDEMIAGFNCTIFAYGQTGTGKTYTMSGDMDDTLGMLSDAAGIIPRALYALFNKLEIDDAESSVKCSFIELYNEELRDLISADETSKLKIYEDAGKKGHAATFVQGMEEAHIKTAVEGVKLLQNGSHKRQVAATKCNDLSSRSHTVFTVTAYVKRTGENGEDYISAGKLNLVDLAGSENIQRSGAENKRAAEAGLINKSLLTLGRVINALVDKSSHIPYRESKLTRLLQDSLGGRTKTCIIATVSPAKSNLEETISTLDYAFRAKNIRNKPQVNPKIDKKTLLKEFTGEIEKLKSELIATRQRNGVYMTNESFEEMTVERESRRILSEEQSAKIETMEINLRNKVQDLFSLTANFMNLKRENEGTRATLDETKDVLEQTETVLAQTRQHLSEEEMLRKAHERTEEELAEVGTTLISTLEKTVTDVGGLHSKIRRKSNLQSINRGTWGLSQTQVSDVTSLVESRVGEFRAQQEELMASVSARMQSFVQEELEKLGATQAFLGENVTLFEASRGEVSQQTSQAKDKMDEVLEEIKVLREVVKSRVGEGLQGLSGAAERISGEVLRELETFHSQLHTSYSSLGRDFKGMFEDLIKHVNSQKAEVDDLRNQLNAASEALVESNSAANSQLERVIVEEREQAATDRENLLRQITTLVMSQGERQDARIEAKVTAVKESIKSSETTFEASRSAYNQNMDAWNEKEQKLVEEVHLSRENLKTKLKEDWITANEHNASIQSTTKSVHEETIRIVDEQMKDIAIHMEALDDFVSRARTQNAEHHDNHALSLDELSSTVSASYSNIGTHFTSTFDRVKDLGEEMSAKTTTLQDALSPLDTTLRQPLAELRSNIVSTLLQEYVPTGDTPLKMQYQFPTTLPRTEPHEKLLESVRQPAISTTPVASPTKYIPVIFNDVATPTKEEEVSPPSNSTSDTAPTLGLREIDLNIHAGSLSSVPLSTDTALSNDAEARPAFKRSMTASGMRLPQKSAKRATVVPLEGRENNILPVASFSQSTGRRRSPRIGGGLS
ncbi:Kinesin-related motor protein [Pseudogymnoascus australis]